MSILEAKVRRKALLVEDQALVAVVAAEMLDELGFDVIDAATSEAAKKHALANVRQFEFALLDLGLPDQSGEKLIEFLRALRPDLPIIIASGQGTGDLRKRYPSEQGFVVLDKPYDYARLEIAIKATQR